MDFSTVHPALASALADRGYAEPTSVQSAVLEAPPGRDLLVSAQTGSGKTVAYGMACAPTLLGDELKFPRAAAPLALVIAPTRELAQQVHAELGWLFAPAGGVVVSCVGGMDPRRERYTLEAGCHIVVGTPGRLRDHLERGQIDMSALRVVVLDEADEMLDLGFREDLEFILEAAPTPRRTLLFSATIAPPIASLARSFQTQALRIDTVVRNQPHGDISYRAIRVAPNEIEHALVNLLRLYEAPGALVFCATREGVRHLHTRLVERGFNAVALHGELSQGERSHALQALRDGRARVCVATDVAARGLDLPELDLVVHASLPTNRATLLHRSGRTGRAGRKGTCLVLVPYTMRRRAEILFSQAAIVAEWSGPPSAEEIRARDQERLLATMLAEPPANDEMLPLAEALLAQRTPLQLALALIAQHRAKLPAAEDVFDSGSAESAPQARAPSVSRSEAPMRWFRASIGRKNNADPKWLVPLICRLGHVQKKDIGAIRISDRETKFEISEEMAEKFMTAVAGAGKNEVRIEPTTPDTSKPYRFGPKKPGKRES